MLKNKKKKLNLDKLEPPLPAYLFNLVALLANRKNYPVKKVILLLVFLFLVLYYLLVYKYVNEIY